MADYICLEDRFMIGRKQEIAILNKLYESGRSQFVAVYGRKRVGKTYLVSIYGLLVRNSFMGVSS